MLNCFETPFKIYSCWCKHRVSSLHKSWNNLKVQNKWHILCDFTAKAKPLLTVSDVLTIVTQWDGEAATPLQENILFKADEYINFFS